jgi:hypothetical protein
MPTDDLQHLWQCQPVAAAPIDMEEIRRKAARLHRRVRNRNIRETVACGVAVAVLTWFAISKPDLLSRVSFGLLIVGSLYVIWHFLRYGKSKVMPADLALTDAVTFHSRELAHQRDLLRGVFWWYLAPFCPGWLVGAISVGRHSWIPAAGMVVFVGAVMWLACKLNYRAADCLDRQIAELSSFKEG